MNCVMPMNRKLSKAEAAEILNGFQVNWMVIRERETGVMLWETNKDLSFPDKEFEITMPKDIINRKAVRILINFSSVQGIEKLRLEQKILFKGRNLEQWYFKYGLVMPNSTNTWESVIEAAPEAQMMPVNVLNGNVVIEMSFFDKDLLISKSRMRLYYI